MSLLTVLRDSPLSEWLSLSMLGVPTLMGLHSVGMAVAVGLSLMVTLRLNRVFVGFGAERIPGILGIAVWGFALNFVTGLGIFVTRAPDYLGSYLFLFKLCLVAVGAAMLFWLRRRLSPAASSRERAPEQDRATRHMSLVSTVALFAAVIAGRMLAYLSDLY